VISAHYFSRTDVARNWLGVITIAAFVVHWCVLHLFQRSIEKFRNRLAWIYRSYFLFQRRRARGVGCAAGTKVILVAYSADRPRFRDARFLEPNFPAPFEIADLFRHRDSPSDSASATTDS